MLKYASRRIRNARCASRRQNIRTIKANAPPTHAHAPFPVHRTTCGCGGNHVDAPTFISIYICMMLRLNGDRLKPTVVLYKRLSTGPNRTEAACDKVRQHQTRCHKRRRLQFTPCAPYTTCVSSHAVVYITSNRAPNGCQTNL